MGESFQDYSWIHHFEAIESQPPNSEYTDSSGFFDMI